MAHVFDGKLYFTRDHMQGNFIPKNLTLPKPKPAPKPQPKASSSGEHVQLLLCIPHCLCQHLCKPEIFMFPRPSCVCMHLEMWAEVKGHSYHARAHVCVGSCIYCA